MFVRWKVRRQSRFLGRYRGNWSEPGEWIASAVLVEGVRVEGKPRQRFVRHLGTIREADVTVPRPMSLDRFWTQVGAVLDELGIHGTDRLAIEGTISARAPRPASEAVAEHRRGFEAWKANMQTMLEGRGRPRRSAHA